MQKSLEKILSVSLSPLKSKNVSIEKVAAKFQYHSYINLILQLTFASTINIISGMHSIILHSVQLNQKLSPFILYIVKLNKIANLQAMLNFI